jgi:hypothetical protein
MRTRLIIFFCVISFSASAQFWNNISFKKKHLIFPSLQQAKNHTFRYPARSLELNKLQVQPLILKESDFSIQCTSQVVMEMAKHNMRFRIYNDASYNFSELAALYVKLHRLSEAKWYLLQSNNISRQENDDKHTVSNLISLAAIKVDIGDASSARADLVEARDMARARGMQPEIAEIDKKMLLLDQNIAPAVKPEIKYAETAGGEKKAL